MFFDAPHITFRNGHPYFMIRVPSDLLPKFNSQRYIRKALKVKTPGEAKLLADSMSLRVRTSFTLLRSGQLTEEMENSIVSSYVFQKKKPAQRQIVRLTDVFKLYFAEKSKRWTSKTQGEYSSQFDKVVAVLGNVGVNSLTREQLVTVRDKLLETLSITTVNCYMSLLSSVLRWGVQHDHVQKNHAEGLLIEKRKKADEERKAYDLDDIKRIKKHLPPKDGKEPHKFWIVNIAILSGMRREEICQLEATDIREVDGIWCFDINNAGEKNTKTKCSARIVPIHPRLIDMGFLEFVKAVPQGGNLWGFTQWRGIWGKRFGNWWSEYFNRQYVTTDPLKCFHSFRHTVADTLKQKGVQESIISELLGHANDSITMARYGKRYQPKVLLEVVSRIDYQ